MGNTCTGERRGVQPPRHQAEAGGTSVPACGVCDRLKELDGVSRPNEHGTLTNFTPITQLLICERRSVKRGAADIQKSGTHPDGLKCVE